MSAIIPVSSCSMSSFSRSLAKFLSKVSRASPGSCALGREVSLLQRGSGLQQCLLTQERRSKDQHDFGWYTCCVPLAELFTQICGGTARITTTESQHVRVQQGSETRGGHSHPTLGTLEIGTGRRAGVSGHDDAGVRRFQRDHECSPFHVGQVGHNQLRGRKRSPIMRQRCRGAQISLCANADELRVDIEPS